MSIRRFIYLIVSSILLITLISFTIAYNYGNLSLIIIAILVFPYFLILNSEKNNLRNIIISYGYSCDTNTYIESITKLKKSYLSKSNKIMFDLYIASAYIDKGEFDKAKEILFEIEKIKNTNIGMSIMYIKVWCDYYYYTRYDEKMKCALLKMKDLINQVKRIDIKKSLYFIYFNLEAKYYILTNTNIPKAKNILSSQGMCVSNLSLASLNYNLALIDIYENNLISARLKLEDVIKKNNNLFIVKESRNLLNELDK